MRHKLLIYMRLAGSPCKHKCRNDIQHISCKCCQAHVPVCTRCQPCQLKFRLSQLVEWSWSSARLLHKHPQALHCRRSFWALISSTRNFKGYFEQTVCPSHSHLGCPTGVALQWFLAVSTTKLSADQPGIHPVKQNEQHQANDRLLLHQRTTLTQSWDCL